MNNNSICELNSSEMQNISGGTGISTALGFLAETFEMAGKATWKFISTPGVGSETLMNCI